MLRRLLVNLGITRSYAQSAFEVPRQWSNAELRRFSDRFEGSAINVSAWEDKDKEGHTYRTYFARCNEYSISNYGTDQGVMQGASNEVYLDLQAPLPKHLQDRFDVVYNHTSLEHIWDFRTAFQNLCMMSRDTLVVVVPWLQPLHADYGDYWRFSPAAVVKLCEENGMTPLHVSWNEAGSTAVYVFCVASRQPGKWASRYADMRPIQFSPDLLRVPADFAGKDAFKWRPWRGVATRRIWLGARVDASNDQEAHKTH